MATATKTKKQWVVTKADKFATVGGGLGSKPKVYTTVKAAQLDIDSIPKLKGGVVKPYGGDAPNAVPTGGPGLVSGTDTTVANGSRSARAGIIDKGATTTGAKAATPKGAKATTPKRAAAGK